MKLFPLTSSQKSILLFQQIHPESPLFNIGGYALINGQIIPSVFFSAFENILDKYPTLRLRLYNSEGDYLQYVPEIRESQVKYIDLSDELLPVELCINWINRDIEKKIDIVDGCLHESTLLKISDTNYYWFLKLHHVIIDGFSIALIFNEMCVEYEKIIEQRSLKDEEEIPTSISFIDQEIRYKHTAQYKFDKNFWTKKLKDCPPPISFNMEFKNSDLISNREKLVFTREEFEKINKFCKESNLSVFHYFIGTLYIYIVNTSLMKDFVIGVPVHNRPNQKAKQSVGPFFNVLPMRLNYNCELTVMELMKKIKLDIFSYMKHMHFPIFDMIQTLNQSGNFYNTSFSFQKMSYNPFLGNNNKAEIIYLKSKEQMNDLDIHILDFNDNWNLEIVFDYKTTFIPAGEAKILLFKFKDLLCNLFVNNSKRVSEIDIFSDGETPLTDFANFSF